MLADVGSDMSHWRELRRLLSLSDGKLTRRDLYRHWSGHLSKAELDGAISDLLSRDDRVRLEKVDTGGRPRELIYRI